MYSDKICFVVPKADRIPTPLLPFFIFETSVWVALLFCVLFCAICLSVLHLGSSSTKIPSARKIRKNQVMCIVYAKIFIDTVILFIGAPLYRISSRWPERVFSISIRVVSFVVIAYFMSFLDTFLVMPIYYDDIDSLEQLHHSGLRIHITSEPLINDLFSTNSWQRSKIDVVQADVPLLDQIGNGVRFTALPRVSSLHTQYAEWFLMRRLHVIRGCIRTYNLAYVGRPNDHFMDEVNVILSRILMAGLINKWIKDMYFNTTLSNLHLYKNLSTLPYRAFSMNDMKFPFYIYAICVTISLIVFFVELLMHNSWCYDGRISNRKKIIK